MAARTTSVAPMPDATRSRWRPVAQVSAGAVMISFSPVWVNIARVSPTTSAFYRVFLGGAVLWIVVLATRRRVIGSVATLLLAAACGFLLAGDLALWHRAIKYVGPGLATILGNLQVFVLAGFGVLVYRERLTVRLAVGILVAIAGLFLMFGLDWATLSPSYRLGIWLGLLTAITYGAFLLLLRQTQSRPDALSSMAMVAWLSLFATLGLSVAVPLERQTFAVPDAGTAWALVAYAVLTHVIGWVLISSGLPLVQASRAGLILLLQPSLAFVWDVLLFHRPTGPLEAVGAALAVAAIYLGVSGGTSGKRPRRATAPVVGEGSTT